MFIFILKCLLKLNRNSSKQFFSAQFPIHLILDSIVVSIPACHAGDRGSIPRRGDILHLTQRFSDTSDVFRYLLLFCIFSSQVLKTKL